MVVGDQNDSGIRDFVANIALSQDFFVRSVSIPKIAQILPSGRGIKGTNLTFDAGDGVELGRRCAVIVRFRWLP